MWFIFGMITLLAAVYWNFSQRLAAGWHGERRSVDNKNYEVQETTGEGKRRTPLLRIGMDIPDNFHFTIRPETPRDRWYKHSGLTVERQFGDLRFDYAYYLESDDAALGQLLTERADLREILMEAIGGLKRMVVDFRFLRCTQGRLWFEVAPKRESQRSAIETLLLGPLHAFAQALRTQRPRDELTVRDPFVWRAALVLAISTGSFVFGFIWLTREKFVATPLLDPWGMFVATMLLSVMLWGLYLYFVLRWLGRSSRTHLVLVEVVLVGGLGFLASGFFLAREINMTLDFQAARPAIVEKAELRLARGRKGGISYYINLQGPIDASGQARSIRIDGDTYSRLRSSAEPGYFEGSSSLGPLRVQVRPGALGFAWVERIDVIAPK